MNHRHLQVQVRSELRDLALEDALRRRAGEVLVRGSVTISAAWIPSHPGGIALEALAASWRQLKELADRLGAPTPTLEGVARLGETGKQQSEQQAAPLILQAFEEALAGCQELRRCEGASLQTACRAMGRHLGRLRTQLATAAPGRIPQQRQRLEERLQDLLGKAVEPAELVRELALYADRLDVSEELVRLDSHLQQLDRLLENADQAPVGRTIEFLLQEIGRELNTTGTKANDAAMQTLVVEGKAVLEQLREQVANIL